MRVHVGAVVLTGSAALVMVLAGLPDGWEMPNDDAVRWLLFILVLGVWRIVTILDPVATPEPSNDD